MKVKSVRIKSEIRPQESRCKRRRVLIHINNCKRDLVCTNTLHLLHLLTSWDRISDFIRTNFKCIFPSDLVVTGYFLCCVFTFNRALGIISFPNYRVVVKGYIEIHCTFTRNYRRDR